MPHCCGELTSLFGVCLYSYITALGTQLYCLITVDDRFFSTHRRAITESWIQVEQRAEGTLIHNHSEEDLEKLLAAAAVDEGTEAL